MAQLVFVFTHTKSRKEMFWGVTHNPFYSFKVFFFPSKYLIWCWMLSRIFKWSSLKDILSVYTVQAIDRKILKFSLMFMHELNKSTHACTRRTSIAGLFLGSWAKCSNLLCISTSSALSTFTSNAYLQTNQLNKQISYHKIKN